MHWGNVACAMGELLLFYAVALAILGTDRPGAALLVAAGADLGSTALTVWVKGFARGWRRRRDTDAN